MTVQGEGYEVIQDCAIFLSHIQSLQKMKASKFVLYLDWLSSNMMFKFIIQNLPRTFHDVSPFAQNPGEKFSWMKLQKGQLFLFQLILWCWSNITCKNSVWEKRDGETCHLA